MKKTLIVLLFVIAIGGSLFYFMVYPRLSIVSGYNAKILCSCVFVSEIDADRAQKEDLGFSLLWLATNKIDYNAKTVKTHVLGMHPKTAVYRDGLGCTLMTQTASEAFLNTSLATENLDYADEIWPENEVAGSEKIQQAIAKAFDDNQNNELYKTRAVVVVKDGTLLGERYAEGFTKETKLLGWSMTKSVTSALAGILEKQGYWKPDDPMHIKAWANDDRSQITLEHVLTQTTGLNWNEDYANVSPATVMLYNSTDMYEYTVSQDLKYTPGSVWEYSSGNSNILAGAMKQAFGNTEAYLAFPQQALFAPLGIRDFVFETDASNKFVGSSYGYGTARDWAKLGLLYFWQGNWQGNQIIDTAWVEQSVKPAVASKGLYGYQFWLNQGETYAHYSKEDYWMNGFQGQRVSVHPESKLVVVRLGVTYNEDDFPFDDWIREIKEAAKEIEVPSPSIIEEVEETEEILEY